MPAHGRDVLVLCYHSIVASGDETSVAPDAFERQVGALLRKGYVPMLASSLSAPARPTKSLIVTFDDGYRSVVESAAPILQSLGVVATVFVTTQFVGSEVTTSGAKSKGQGLSWDALRELAGSGWEVGSHSVTHARLPDLDDASLEAELEDSKQLIESQLESSCRSFAYPFGLVNDRVEGCVRRAGYDQAFTVPRRMAEPTAYRWPRVSVLRSDGRLSFNLKTSTSVRLFRRTALGSATAGSVARARRPMRRA
jgi:peptidoglycan/xylan/chitin deacetylase (PgdA/CDA1 family)